MKKRDYFYFVLLIAMLVTMLLLASCEKPEDYCWVCQIAVITRTPEVKYIKYCTPDTLCGYSEKDIMKYENWKSTPPRIINDCGDLKWQECICTLNEE